MIPLNTRRSSTLGLPPPLGIALQSSHLLVHLFEPNDGSFVAGHKSFVDAA